MLTKKRLERLINKLHAIGMGDGSGPGDQGDGPSGPGSDANGDGFGDGNGDNFGDGGWGTGQGFDTPNSSDSDFAGINTEVAAAETTSGKATPADPKDASSFATLAAEARAAAGKRGEDSLAATVVNGVFTAIGMIPGGSIFSNGLQAVSRGLTGKSVGANFGEAIAEGQFDRSGSLYADPSRSMAVDDSAANKEKLTSDSEPSPVAQVIPPYEELPTIVPEVPSAPNGILSRDPKKITSYTRSEPYV